MTAATDRFGAWCKQEQASIEQEVELIASGKVRIQDIGSGWIDKTEEAIERAKRRLSQLNELLTEEGKTTFISRMPYKAHSSSPPKFASCFHASAPNPHEGPHGLSGARASL